MPSRKYSANSEFSTSSQKTFTSSNCSSTNGYRRTASMHQINELYHAINDLISPSQWKSTTPSHDSVSLCKSDVTRSQSNLPGKKTKISNLRPVRSTSNVSSKSCFASLATNRMNNKQFVIDSKTSKDSKGFYSRVVSKLRGKKSQRKEDCKLDGKQVQSIDDLLDFMASNETKKLKKQKIFSRKKADSFDSFESNSSVISVDDVSSKLRNWHTWATSFAADQESEARLRADSLLTESTEERFQNDLTTKGQTKPICFLAESEDADDGDPSLDQTADFDASSIDALENYEEEAEKHSKREKLHLKPTKSDSEAKLSTEKSKKTNRMPGLIHRHSDIGATNHIALKASRAVSRRLLDDVFTGRSISYEHINRMRGSARDISKQRVQKWLEDLNKNLPRDDQETKVDFSSKNEDESKIEIENGETERLPKSRGRLPSQPLFYIPNIEDEDNNSSLRMIIQY